MGYFVTTKIPGGLNDTEAEANFASCLADLQTPYVDLLLIHFPATMDGKSSGGKAGRQREWKVLERLYKSGKARAIGVSHYCQRHLEDVMEIATVPIALNQQEWHVGMGSDPVGIVSFCKKHGIVYQSFSPLCGPCAPNGTSLVHGHLVSSIGKAHGVSGAQVSLRWLVKQGSPVIPKSSNPAHIKEDLDLFNWAGGDLT